MPHDKHTPLATMHPEQSDAKERASTAQRVRTDTEKQELEERQHAQSQRRVIQKSDGMGLLEEERAALRKNTMAPQACNSECMARVPPCPSQLQEAEICIRVSVFACLGISFNRVRRFLTRRHQPAVSSKTSLKDENASMTGKGEDTSTER